MLHRIVKTIDLYHMLPAQARVLCGFSGGADSTALLVALCELSDHYNIELRAVHVNHSQETPAIQRLANGESVAICHTP